MAARRLSRAAPPSSKQVSEKCDQYFKSMSLTTFTILIPMTSAETAQRNKDGIAEKLLKNRSNLVTEFNSEASIDAAGEKPMHDEEAVSGIKQLMSWLVHSKVSEAASQPGRVGTGGRLPFTGSLAHWHKECRRGVVVLVAEPIEEEDAEVEAAEHGKPKWRPVGGGIISWREGEQHERQINALWCRRTLTAELEDSNFLQYLCIRVMAAAFCWEPDGLENAGDILVSVLDIYLRHFPRDAVNFLTSSEEGCVGLGSHYETATDGGKHEANPRTKCRCSRLMQIESAWRFWGCNESRFRDVCKKFLPPESTPRRRATIDPSGTTPFSALSGGSRDRRSFPGWVGDKIEAEYSAAANGDSPRRAVKRRRDC